MFCARSGWLPIGLLEHGPFGIELLKPLQLFWRKGELIRLEIFSHVLLIRGPGQREHADLHGKPKHDLRETSTIFGGHGTDVRLGKDFPIGSQQ